jgi:mannose/fructose/N-acetylgalactosamine-specific phosphotransferase system component IIC
MNWILAHPTDAALAALATTTAIAMAIRVLIPSLSAIAAHTATKEDDEAVTKLASWLDWLIVALDTAKRFLPRVVVGPLPSTQPIATSIAPIPPAKPLSAPPPAGGDNPLALLTRPNAPPPPPKEPTL